MNLAKAFINQPEVVLLDEPPASLKPESAHVIREFILRLCRYKLLDSHRPHLVGNYSRIRAGTDRLWGAEYFLRDYLGVIIWVVVYRSQMDVGIGLLDELWNKNLINIFASPLRFSEWVVSLLIFSFCKAVIAVLFGCFVAWLLYDFALIPALSWYLVPLFFVLVLNGWWLGLLIQAIIMRLTTKAQSGETASPPSDVRMSHSVRSPNGWAV